MYENNDYTNYVTGHKSNLDKVWNAMIPILVEKYNVPPPVIEVITKNIANHDASKSSPEEFEAYARHWYPEDGKKPNKESDEYKMAWLHHMQNNKHHWNHWIIVDSKTEFEAVEMPFIYIMEMLVDWSAQGLNPGSEGVKKWYNDNKKDFIMHKNTTKFIKMFIDSFDTITKLLI